MKQAKILKFAPNHRHLERRAKCIVCELKRILSLFFQRTFLQIKEHVFYNKNIYQEIRIELNEGINFLFNSEFSKEKFESEEKYQHYLFSHYQIAKTAEGEITEHLRNINNFHRSIHTGIVASLGYFLLVNPSVLSHNLGILGAALLGLWVLCLQWSYSIKSIWIRNAAICSVIEAIDSVQFVRSLTTERQILKRLLKNRKYSAAAYSGKSIPRLLIVTYGLGYLYILCAS